MSANATQVKRGSARRFLLLWGLLALAMFAIAAAITAVLVHVSIVESEYQPIGMYGAYRKNETGWIYYELRRNGSDFLIYYPAGTKFVALPYGDFAGCVKAGPGKINVPSSDVERSQYERHPFYIVTISNRPKGADSGGQIKCTIAFEPRRESFTGLTMDMWFLPSLARTASPVATLNFSAIAEGADDMEVFGARATSSSGADLTPDDEAVIKFTDIRRAGLRDIALVLIGAFVALGAAMALEAIRPYVESRAGLRP